MRTAFFAALLMLGTTACLRGATGPDPDASSNGNNNNNNNGSNGSNGNTNHPDAGNNGSNGNMVDAGTGSNGNMTDAGMTGGFQCKNKVTSVGSGHHNAGQDCNGACHDHGFSLAGTLYTTAAGNTVISGATITAIDASGQTVNMVTQADGNFYSTTPVSFPVKIYASECQISQTAQMMVSQVQSSSNGGCNSGACHGGSQGAVHLP